MQSSEHMDGQKFSLLESGLYAPAPDGKTAVKLSTVGFSQDVDGELEEVLATIATFLSEPGEWWHRVDPRYGAPIAIHRRFLENLQGAGTVWIDLDMLKIERQNYQLAKMHAGKGRR